MKTALALLLAPFLALPIAACANDKAAYPSLAPRAIETLGFAEPEVAMPEAKPDPALDARIATLDRSLDALAKGFAADAARADTAATRARGKAAGSDAWLDAQTALAALDDWRAQTSALLTDVDQIASDRAAALTPDYPALSSLRARVAAESARQGSAIDRIQTGLAAT